MTHQQFISNVRLAMEQANIDAYLVPSSDPHISEYMPEYYKCIQFASGFTGSAGTLVITKQFAGLWTDFRYFEQAGQQLSGSGFELVKLKVQHTPEFIEWLYEELPPALLSHLTKSFYQRRWAVPSGPILQQKGYRSCRQICFLLCGPTAPSS
ncbi:aminopeptidase P family N-terminal domain-containing protein [Arcticibacter sp. MXS-1]|uniref:aminopeptidase P family N-terminal domain-containing protein n=1 Tax=Arcticibacter sp. MXS-1 TaxID=3341726 RepID=UPI0035A91F16